MGNELNLPYYIRFTIKLFMIILLGAIIIYAKSLLVPLAFAILLAILLLPMANFFENKLLFSRGLSAITCIIIGLALISALIYFLSQQISLFVQDIPSIKEHLLQHYKTLMSWIRLRFNMNRGQQNELINTATSGVKSSGTAILGETVTTLTSSIFVIIIIAIYSFLILYYRRTIRIFLYEVFKKPLEEHVTCVLQESKIIIQKYMAGLFIEMCIVAIANTLLLLILGVQYAIFLGVFAAILNIIPYIGILTGLIFTCLVTLTTTTDLSPIFWIAIGMWVIHFIDSNFLMPKIVGSRVKINALATIIGVVIGSILIGLPGIFLALPVIAILKVIFDRVEDLKPWGKLIGDDSSESKLSGNTIKKLRRRITRKNQKL